MGAGEHVGEGQGGVGCGADVKADAYASWRHYAEHLLPIWQALPADIRGIFYAPRDVCQWHPFAGLTEGIPDHRDPGPVLVAGFADHHTVRPRPTFLVNHGAGQHYVKTKGAESFSGGPGRDRVLLHLEPGPLAAAASDAAGHRYVQVGMPFLDPWHIEPPTPERGLVVVALHHNGRGAPEQMSAWPHFADAFRDLAGEVVLLGHGHPRGWERTANRWAQMGVPTEPRFSRVLDRAALLITDVSSAGPMFASTGRPVVWVSAPWHTSAPESGGRFHDWTRAVQSVGGHVTEPDQLVEVVKHHLAHPRKLVAAQQAIVDDVFVECDGFAGLHAAAEIVRVLGRVEPHLSAAPALQD